MPVPVRLAWPQMAYAPGLSVPVPLHMLAAHFPQAFSSAAGQQSCDLHLYSHAYFLRSVYVA